MVETDVRRLFWNQWSILGSTMGNDASSTRSSRELGEGALLPPVDAVFPLERARAAFERLAHGEQFGKVVVRMRVTDARRSTSRRRSSASARRSSRATRRECPRGAVALTTRPIGGGSFGLGYARKREWLICPPLQAKRDLRREARDEKLKR